MTFSIFNQTLVRIMNNTFPTNISEIKDKLNNFCKDNLKFYSSRRNFDYGPPHNNVSNLSPYISRRIISENQVLQSALTYNSLNKIEKFVQEIFWKTYWRGWLELHPWIYESYDSLNFNEHIPQKTGIKCFDYWTEELIETGYLHNHARMWYASIWIFTLKKNWVEGANFFKKYLLDWCPASNTLSWRWVAGLQTIGKNYSATASNIKFFSNNRFNPKNQLVENPPPIESDCSNKEQSNFNYSDVKNLDELKNIGLVLTNNDLSLNLVFEKLKINFEKALFKQKVNLLKSDLVNKFESKIFEEILNNEKNFEFINSLDGILDWCLKKKIKNLILPYEMVGCKILENKDILIKLSENDIKYIFYMRDWDKNAFSYANKGFFPFKKKIPDLLKINHII